ncbi:DUF3500 domain-containing protein [Planctomycetes bacterium TBK1r]|uniref:DUF3500 domain-containing protein n=1 Tax=Stieleria magnilauensis TaxID=2527963 RepID=A0ABX5XVV8_9BACT|nr:hypothetical protein TBK1r_51070 [Planctomycetes bacterium TBK1r]
MNTRITSLLLPLLLVSVASAHPGHESNPADEMAAAANAFIQWLTPEQKGKAVLEFKADERENWHYVPFDRQGIKLSELSPVQDHYAYALLNTGLSQKGFMTATTIMSLEQILREKENRPDVRDPEKYYVTIFGKPGKQGAWGWRFEGHHLSLNYTIVDGKVAVTPAFFGTNPAEVREGPRSGIRPLGAMEDIARKLGQSLGNAAVFSDKPPKEILSGQDRTASPPEEQGVKGSDMNSQQRELLLGVLSEFASNGRQEISGEAMQKIRDAADNLRFAWAGSTKRGEAHYFRIVMPQAFLVEYANTQNDANHAHATWRLFNGDFGRDLLGEHISQAH